MKNCSIFLINLCLFGCMQLCRAGTFNDTSFVVLQASIDYIKQIIELDAAISYEYFKPLLLQYSEYEGKEYEVEKMLAIEVGTDALWFADCIAMKDSQRLFIARNDIIIV